MVAYDPLTTPPNTYLPQGQTALTNAPSWINGPNAAQTNNLQVDVFSEFNKLFGRNPTQSELDQFTNYYQGSDPNIANSAGGNQAISSYFNQQQQAAQAPQQEADALQKQIPILNNLIQSQTQAASKDLLDPSSPTYQQFSGLMNNMGITPSSGAFQSGLGGQIGQNANQAINAALGSVGLPIASTYAQGATQPFQNAMSQPGQLFGNNLEMQNMIQQMMAASGLAQQSKPSALQTDIGMASGAAQGAGNLAKGSAALAQVTWVCTQLHEEGLLTGEEVNKLHDHLFRAFWKRPFKFIGYFIFGKILVGLANSVRTHWGTWKPEFYDKVIREDDPAKAVDLYEESFWELFRIVRSRLGKEPVYGR